MISFKYWNYSHCAACIGSKGGKRMDRIKYHAHYKREWAFLHPLATLIARLFLRFRAKVESPPGPFLLLSNHLTDQDPILLGSAFRPQMYFVASEHILR